MIWSRIFGKTILIFAVVFIFTGSFVSIFREVEASPSISNVVAALQALVGTKLYLNDLSTGAVSIIDTAKNTVSTTGINIGTGLTYAITIGSDIYVSNTNAGTLDVINTTNNTLAASIPVGGSPTYFALVGTKLYVDNTGSNTISVVDTTNNTVIDTISVGTAPIFPVLVGTKLYVTDNNSDDVSVIDTATDTVTRTIAVGHSPQLALLVGTKVYVANHGSNTLSVIDTTTDTVVSTVTVGNAPAYGVLSGTKLYISNIGSNTVSVIDTTTGNVTSTISVGIAPFFSTLVGSKLYVGNIGGNTVSVIDTGTDAVVATVTVGTAPGASTSTGTDLYVTNTGSNSVSIIDTTTDALVPVPPPVLQGAKVNGKVLMLTYDETLNTGSTPVSSDFVVNVNSDPVAIADVVVAGKTVIITLTNPIVVSDTVTINYTPGTHPLQDLTLTDAGLFTNEPVTNNTVSYTLNYNAGANGLISGATSQTVSANTDGTTVTATPNTSYLFSGWSDGSHQNPRTDMNVTGNISVTANFAIIPVRSGSVSGGCATSLGYVWDPATFTCSLAKVPASAEMPTASPIPTISSVSNILGSGICPANLILTDFMREGDKNEVYDSYNKKTVTQVRILQGHINRILASQYQQAAGPIDGFFGPLTKTGVERLQTALNLVLKPTPTLKIDGIVGPFTRAAINNSCGVN